jgi:exodeoxyribonuclease VII small subunit
LPLRGTRENCQANNEQPWRPHPYLLRQIPATASGSGSYTLSVIQSGYAKSASSRGICGAPANADHQTVWRQWKSRFFLRATMLNSKFAMASSAKKPETSFETAMERLEKIVEEMESGKMLLEDLLVRYEEGMKLVKICQDRLAHAEQKIQIITRDHAGKTSVKDFAAAETPMAADAMKEKDNDDVRLF